jgi:hypothetical protein
LHGRPQPQDRALHFFARCRQQNPNPTRPSILLSRHGHPILIRSTPPSASGPRDRDTNLRVGGTLDSRFCIGVSLSARFSAPPLLLLSLGPRVLLICDLARRINGTLCSHNKHYALLPLRNNSKKKNFHSETTTTKKTSTQKLLSTIEAYNKSSHLATPVSVGCGCATPPDSGHGGHARTSTASWAWLLLPPTGLRSSSSSPSSSPRRPLPVGDSFRRALCTAAHRIRGIPDQCSLINYYCRWWAAGAGRRRRRPTVPGDSQGRNRAQAQGTGPGQFLVLLIHPSEEEEFSVLSIRFFGSRDTWILLAFSGCRPFFAKSESDDYSSTRNHLR